MLIIICLGDDLGHLNGHSMACTLEDEIGSARKYEGLNFVSLHEVNKDMQIEFLEQGTKEHKEKLGSCLKRGKRKEGALNEAQVHKEVS